MESLPGTLADWTFWGAVGAVGTFLVTYLLVRVTRTGTRSDVKVENWSGTKGGEPYFIIRVFNRGGGQVTVTGIELMMPPRAYGGIHLTGPLPEWAYVSGPELPHRLAGEDEETWSIAPHIAADFYRNFVRLPINTPRNVRFTLSLRARLFWFQPMRARVHLGGKRTKKAMPPFSSSEAVKIGREAVAGRAAADEAKKAEEAKRLAKAPPIPPRPAQPAKPPNSQLKVQSRGRKKRR